MKKTSIILASILVLVLGWTAVANMSSRWDSGTAGLGNLEFWQSTDHAILGVVGFEAKDAAIRLEADESDDAADTWQIRATAGGSCVFSNQAAGTILTLNSTGVVPSGGTSLAYANKTANYTNTATDCVLSFNTSAVTTNTLLEASTVLGKVFWISLQDDDGDLVVVTDGTDTFDGTNNKATFADAGDSLCVMATAANVYTILVNVGGTLATQ